MVVKGCALLLLGGALFLERWVGVAEWMETCPGVRRVGQWACRVLADD